MTPKSCGRVGTRRRAQSEITELKSAMRGRHIGHSSAGNLRISGSLNDRIAKTLI